MWTLMERPFLAVTWWYLLLGVVGRSALAAVTLSAAFVA